MTVTELHPNGKLTPERRAEIVRQIVADGRTPSRQDLVATYGGADGSWGNTIRAVKAERQPASVASPAREVPPPKLPAPPAIAPVTSTNVRRKRRLVVATKVAVGLVTAVAALMSYSGLRQLALAAGLGWHADILPLAVDGLVAACLFVRVVLPHNGTARAAMWVALAGSVAANAAVYGPWQLPLGYIAAAMAGFVPVAAAVGYHLLGRMLKECK